jgi:hypothetical protein
MDHQPKSERRRESGQVGGARSGGASFERSVLVAVREKTGSITEDELRAAWAGAVQAVCAAPDDPIEDLRARLVDEVYERAIRLARVKPAEDAGPPEREVWETIHAIGGEARMAASPYDFGGERAPGPGELSSSQRAGIRVPGIDAIAGWAAAGRCIRRNLGWMLAAAAAAAGGGAIPVFLSPEDSQHTTPSHRPTTDAVAPRPPRTKREATLGADPHRPLLAQSASRARAGRHRHRRARPNRSEAPAEGVGARGPGPATHRSRPLGVGPSTSRPAAIPRSSRSRGGARRDPSSEFGIEP